MGFLDKAKSAVVTNKGKVGGLVSKHGDKIDQGLHHAARFADKKTGGKHTSKIAQGQQRVRGALDGLGSDTTPQPGPGPSPQPGPGTTPPPPPEPSPGPPPREPGPDTAPPTPEPSPGPPPPPMRGF